MSGTFGGGDEKIGERGPEYADLQQNAGCDDRCSMI